MKNKYYFEENYCVIIVYGDGKYHKCFIDKDDFTKADSIRGNWCARKCGGVKSYLQYYVVGQIEPFRTEMLHRFLFDYPDEEIDHKNHNGLDNRRSNLRLTNRVQNGFNRCGAMINSKSGIRGVFWHKRDKLWIVKVTIKGKSHRVGGYKSKEEAELESIKFRKKIEDTLYK